MSLSSCHNVKEDDVTMTQLLKERSIKKILVLAILLRLLLMPFFFHPDIKTYDFQTSFLGKGVFNIYPYLLNHRPELPLKEEFVYFPLTYLVLGAYQVIVSPLLGPDFNSWLSNAGQTALSDPNIYRYLFLLKLPYLVMDVAVAFLLTSFYKSMESKKRVLTLWLFNPFSIVLIYIFSNVDVFPVFLTVWSLLLAKQKRLIWSALLLGVAAGFKAYSFLFLPFLLLYTDSWKERALMLLSSLGVLVVIIAPFYSKAFMDSALVSGLTTRLITAGIPLGFGENIFITLFLMAVLFFWQMEKKIKIDLPIVYIVVLAILFSFIHFNIQWLLWVMPFVVLLLVRNRELSTMWIVLGAIVFLIPFLYDDKSMSVSLLSVINPVYTTLPTAFTVVQKIYDPGVVQSALHTMLAAGALLTSYKLLKEKVWED